MTRVLFVDDEPAVLEGLQMRLRKQRHRWEMSFRVGAQAALTEMERASYDVIVSDMRMPGVDGATLLERVHHRYPDVVRIVLSGQMDERFAFRSLPHAHQFIAKPCDPGLLEDVIERSCALRERVAASALRGRLGALQCLPVHRPLHRELRELLSSVDAPAGRVAAVVGSDPGMCARILQLANSAMFGAPEGIASISEAVEYLGLDMLKDLVLFGDVFGLGAEPGASAPLSMAEHRAHAVRVARLAQVVAAPQDAGDAYVAGLLHDLGSLLVAQEAPHLWEASGRGWDLEAEVRLLGCTHAELGGYLLALWGLPLRIVEAVAHHHAVDRCSEPCRGVVAAVHLADTLVQQAEGRADARVDPSVTELLGARDLDRWRLLAQRLVQSEPAR